MTYKFYYNGKLIEPKDSGMKRYCTIRPNYDSIPLSSGDYQIVRYWTNSKGKPACTVIYSSVGNSDHEHIVRCLNRQAKQHFSIRLYECSNDAYMKYAVSYSNVHAAIDEIKRMQKTIGGFHVHEATRQEYVAKLEQWLDFTFTYEKQRFNMLLNLFGEVDSRHYAWKNVDFLALQNRTGITEQEYNEKLYTLQCILKSLCTIRLFERMTGYYLKNDALAMREGENE